MSINFLNDTLIIADHKFSSRLMIGTGKYKTTSELKQCIVNSNCDIITVAIRRAQSTTKSIDNNWITDLDWQNKWLLPNTAGCKTAEEAIRVAILGRQFVKKLGQVNNNFVKLEVIPDSKNLLPDPIGTLKAAEYLITQGFDVLPYINADPILAKQLEELGCVTVMPLASPIGSGQGIKNLSNIQIIIDNANVPVVIDAGLGSASDVALAFELGADAVLVNTAIAKALIPEQMATAIKMATQAGRLSYLSGRMPISSNALASSPNTGIIN
uniref:Thiazole synthase n=1 Tax=Bulboplastis apyrenoidosa TaxID=1070855 RepID=A0A1Y9TM76_9RHOD|nr:thiazole biosynthesis protein ThiG [Bulboplastis apyrenoidosa]ARO90741.1 thiazole biosynthesis protein ThiG [Bulboplastis apyrenoidosa]